MALIRGRPGERRQFRTSPSGSIQLQLSKLPCEESCGPSMDAASTLDVVKSGAVSTGSVPLLKLVWNYCRGRNKEK